MVMLSNQHGELGYLTTPVAWQRKRATGMAEPMLLEETQSCQDRARARGRGGKSAIESAETPSGAA